MVNNVISNQLHNWHFWTKTKKPICLTEESQCNGVGNVLITRCLGYLPFVFVCFLPAIFSSSVMVGRVVHKFQALCIRGRQICMRNQEIKMNKEMCTTHYLLLVLQINKQCTLGFSNWITQTKEKIQDIFPPKKKETQISMFY